MNRNDNPYEILGVCPDSSQVAIKKAYREAAKIHHPDKQKTDEDREHASAYFAKVADAYSLLQDPVRRYDWRMANEGKSKDSSPSSSFPAKSTKSKATTTRPSPQTKRQSTVYSSTSLPKRRSSFQTAASSPPAPRRRESSATPLLRKRHSVHTASSMQSPPLSRTPSGVRRPIRRSSQGSNTLPHRPVTSSSTKCPNPEAGRKKQRSKSVPSINKNIERKPSEIKRKVRMAARRPSLDIQSQHTARSVKSHHTSKSVKSLPIQKASRHEPGARNLRRGASVTSGAPDKAKSTLPARSATSSIHRRQ